MGALYIGPILCQQGLVGFSRVIRVKRTSRLCRVRLKVSAMVRPVTVFKTETETVFLCQYNDETDTDHLTALSTVQFHASAKCTALRRRCS